MLPCKRGVDMRGFGDLEAAIMDRLWSSDRPATGRQVLESLRPERDIAYTTVTTVMENLVHKGWLSRELRQRAYVYQPVASRGEYSARLMREALDQSKDTQEALLHFLAQMNEEESETVRRALRHRAQQQGR